MRRERQKTAHNRVLERGESHKKNNGIYRNLQNSTIVPPSWEDADQAEIDQKEKQMALCIEHWMQRWWPDPHNRPVQILIYENKQKNSYKPNQTNP